MWDVGRIVLAQTAVLVTWGAGILVLAPAAMWGAHVLGWSRTRIAAAGLAGASFALVPATTLARRDAVLGWGRSCLVQPGLSLATPEERLNALLFVPAAFFAMLAIRRAAAIVLAALVSAVFIEAAQLVTGLGTCQTSDVVRNVAGATVACAAAGLLLRTFPAPGAPSAARVGHREDDRATPP
ncbi:MAG: VanZ family protein [Nocardioides sp.]